MFEPSNERRVDSASQALKSFSKENMDDAVVTDLLTNLMHYCKANGIDFQQQVDMATIHFNSET